MKKLILFLLFSIGLQAQVEDNGSKLQITQNLSNKFKIEIDGHIVKKEIFFKTTLDGIEIYDLDKNKYQVRKCDVKDCDIIHLELKNNGVFSMPRQNWQTTNIPNIIGL